MRGPHSAHDLGRPRRSSALTLIRGIHEEHEHRRRLAGTLAGRHVLLVGRHGVPRPLLVEKIRRCGAILARRFDRSVGALVVGDDPPARDLQRAASEGVLVLGSAELDEIVRAREEMFRVDAAAIRRSLDQSRDAARNGTRPGRAARPAELSSEAKARIASQLAEVARMRVRQRGI
jgi:hypothetical protein